MTRQLRPGARFDDRATAEGAMFGEGFQETPVEGCPGARKRCGCLFLLRLVDREGGPALSTDDSGSFVGLGHTRWRARWCPSCGGRVGTLRPELLAAWRRFLAARARHDGALGLREREELAAYCAANGFGPLDGAGYSASATSAADCAELGCSWDPDHERWYTWLSFAPPADLAGDPFVPGSLDD